MTALYQNARPATFAQVVGQDHVKDILSLALQKNRLGHAYLFSGPRGVGKTTTARLLAMAVNCQAEEGVAKPCGKCEACLAVRGNRHPDVLELDAASNNSVDDVRELREKAGLAAIYGGKRVWILDEAHMLSNAAANALLKTLEEPPPHLVFILATTEPEKLPPTILSRCQHFRFRRLSVTEIQSKLEMLCERANIKAEPAALTLVATVADGAMRDAESLLERLLVSGETISYAATETALGLPPKEQLLTLATGLCDNDLQKMLNQANMLYQAGFAPRSLLERLLLLLRDALYSKVQTDTSTEQTVKLSPDTPDLLRVMHALDDELERFNRYNDLFSLEVALIKAHNALQHNVPSDSNNANFVPNVVASAPVASGATTQTPKQTAKTLPDFNPHSSPRANQPTNLQAHKPPVTPKARKAVNWTDIRSKAGTQLKAFMMPAHANIQENQITITFPDKNGFHFEQLKKRKDEFATLLTNLYGTDINFTVLGPGPSLTHKSQIENQAQEPAETIHATKTTFETPQTPTSPPKATATTLTTTSKDLPTLKSTGAQAGQPQKETHHNHNQDNSHDNNQEQGDKPNLTTKNTLTAENTITTENSEDAPTKPAPPVYFDEELPPDFWDNEPAQNQSSQSETHRKETNSPKTSNKKTTEKSTSKAASKSEYKAFEETKNAKPPNKELPESSETALQDLQQNTLFQTLTDIFPGNVIAWEPTNSSAMPENDNFDDELSEENDD